ncbi:MAG: hypothetical protein N3G19_03520 [Candidatus Pacearchaeota archaeon]|nr:hypothetical protein [Candidatus Pacearchaeota archaeon]
MKNIIEIIGSSFKLWWKNFIIVLPFVFNFFLSSVALVLLFLLFFAFLFSKLSLQDLINLGTLSTQAEIEKFSSLLSEPSFLLGFVIFILISVFILSFIRAYFYSGAIAMSSEIVNGRKTNLKTITTNGKKFFWRYWLVQLIINVAIFLWIFVFSLPLILTKNPSFIILTLVSLIPMVLIYVLFLLAEYYLVIEDLKIWETFSKSFVIVKRNYWTMLGLGVLVFLMNIVAGIIPFVGFLVSILIVFPCQTIAFTIFSIERIYRR